MIRDELASVHSGILAEHETKAAPQLSTGIGADFFSLAEVSEKTRQFNKNKERTNGFKGLSHKEGTYLPKERIWLKTFLKLRQEKQVDSIDYFIAS
jgi:hypothetical protein